MAAAEIGNAAKTEVDLHVSFKYAQPLTLGTSRVSRGLCPDWVPVATNSIVGRFARVWRRQRTSIMQCVAGASFDYLNRGEDENML